MKRKKKVPQRINQFYVAHPKISGAISRGENDSWTHPTERAAVEHAKTLLGRNASISECCVVVKIIRIVRRKKMPIEVVKL